MDDASGGEHTGICYPKLTKRYLGRHAVGPSTNSRLTPKLSIDTEGAAHFINLKNCVTPTVDNLLTARLSVSFCAEFEEDVLCAMEKLERDYAAEKLHCASNAKSRANSDLFTAIMPKDGSTKALLCHPVNSRPPQTDTDIGEEHQNMKESIRQDFGNSRFNASKSNAAPNTPCGNAIRCLDSIENDIACTWVTPLHISTPLDTCRKASACITRSNNNVGKLIVEENVGTTRKVLCSKLNTNVEKTKLFATVNTTNVACEEFNKPLCTSENKEDEVDSNKSSEIAEVHEKHCGASCGETKPEDSSATGFVNVSASADRLKLSNWGLPPIVLQRYEERGISSMFEWQAECLCTGKVLAGSNLVYAAPTSAGKTMVTELLMLKCVLETKKKALFILPFVAVAREKVSNLQGLFQDAGIRVDGYFGHISPAGGFSSVDIAICTIEKANSLLNRLLEDGKIDQLGMVVVDELHLVGDSHRGYLLELLLTKLRYVTRRTLAGYATHGSGKTPSNPIQIIGMSATLPNLNVVARWLDAELYRTDFRPIPLIELVKVGTDIYDSTVSTRLRVIKPSVTGSNNSDDGDVVPLCLETVSIGCSVLIFCPTKNWCEKLADSIAREFYRILREGHQRGNGFVKASELVPLKLKHEMLRDVVEQLRRTPAGLDAMLAKTVPLGVSYHHAGLTFDERDIIEGAFRAGALRVLVATSTLSSGVNLPARRVIVRTPMFHGSVIDTLTYKQMVGRAGRKGVDTCGESILICKPNERMAAKLLANCELPPVKSCLFGTGDSASLSSSMKRAILEIVVSKVARTPEEVETYADCTLLAASLSFDVSPRTDSGNDSSVKPYIAYLLENEFITRHIVCGADGKEDFVLAPTQLGSAVVASALSPDEGLAVFAELQKARRCFVLENELHTVYLVTPLYAQDQWGNIDWMQYLCLWEQLPADMKRVAELVGVKENYLARAVRSGGVAPCQTSVQARAAAVHRRFYAAMALHDLANEVSLAEVVRKYGCTRGVLQSLQQSAATFAGMVTVFCSRLGWNNLELILAQFQSRLSFGVQRELIDLVRISVLNAQRARSFFNAGYETVASLANAEPVVLEQIIKKSAPFLSKKKADDEAEWELQERCKSRCIWVTGDKGLTEFEAAKLIIQEAKKLIADDLHEMGVDWKPPAQVDEKSKRGSLDRKQDKKSILKIGHLKNFGSQSKNKGGNRRVSLNSSAVHGNKTVLTPPPSMNYCRRVSVEDRSVEEPTTPNKQARAKSLADHEIQFNHRTEQIVNAAQVISATSDCVVDENVIGNNLKSLTPSCVQEIVKLDSKPKCVGATLQEIPGESVENVSMTYHSGQETGDFNVAIVANASSSTNSKSILMDNVINRSLDGSSSNLFLDSGILNALSSPMTCTELPKRDYQNLSQNNAKDSSAGFVSEQEVRTSCTKNLMKSNTSPDRQPIPIVAQDKRSSLKGNQMNNCMEVCSPDEPLESMSWKKNAVKYTSLVLSADLLPASAYDREQFANIKEMGFSESILFDDDFDAVRPVVESAVHNCNNGSNAEHDEMFSSSFTNKQLCNDVHDRADNSDMFTSFVEQPAMTSDDRVINIETCERPESDVQNKNGEIDDDSFVGTLLERALALLPLAENLDKESRANEISQFEEECEPRECNQSKGMLPPGTGFCRLRSSVNSELSDDDHENGVAGAMQVNDAPNLLTARPMPLVDKHAVANDVLDTYSRARTCIKRSDKGCKVGSENIPRAALKRKASSKAMNKGMSRNENRDPNAECQNNNVSSVSTSDSSSYVPPTPPSSSKTVSAVATPKRLVGGLAGTTPLKSNAPLMTKRCKRDDSFFKSKRDDELRTASRGFDDDSNSVASEKHGFEVMEDISEGHVPQSCHASMSISDKVFTIIDVAANKKLFHTFIAEWRSKQSFSICLACEKIAAPTQMKVIEANSGIGAKFTKGGRKSADLTSNLEQTMDGILIDNGTRIVGIAVSWESYDAYYVSLNSSNPNGDLDGSLIAPTLDDSLSVTDRLTAVQSVLNGPESHDVNERSVTVFDIREQYKLLSQYCGVALKMNCLDPKVACWLLDPAANEKNLHSMITNYCPQDVHLLQGISCGNGLGSIGLSPVATSSGRLRACTEAILVNCVMSCLMSRLRESNLLKAFSDVEMPSLVILAKMELNGMGFSLAESESQKSVIQSKLVALEERAYLLAGHPFSLTSVDDVGQVLFIELGLPSSGDAQSRVRPGTRSTAASTRRAKPSWSTAKDVLEKLKPLHPLPGVLLEWRRLTAALTKTVFPLQRGRTRCDHLAMDRIHSAVDTFTATGRVTMSEPNLQNIPKDFVIQVPNVACGRASLGPTRSTRSRSSIASSTIHSTTNSFSVSMRNSFIPFSGGLLVAADYCQLELRIIAHLSGDRRLIDVLNGGGDVFKIIASQWKMIGVDDVTEVLRQQAKQVCYGMIYGIGPQALGEQLGIGDNEATVFIESFKAKYTGLRSFLRDTVQTCRQVGYVKTILGRRRYLPAISSTNHHAKAHAERQAVNTTVQGSGADLVKTAMVMIDRELSKRYPDTIVGHKHLRGLSVPSSGDTNHKRPNTGVQPRYLPRGGHFILQLHDELIYEVNASDVHAVCGLIKQNMESAMKLTVKLPIKLKTGSSWGSMIDIDL